MSLFASKHIFKAFPTRLTLSALFFPLIDPDTLLLLPPPLVQRTTCMFYTEQGLCKGLKLGILNLNNNMRRDIDVELHVCILTTMMLFFF